MGEIMFLRHSAEQIYLSRNQTTYLFWPLYKTKHDHTELDYIFKDFAGKWVKSSGLKHSGKDLRWQLIYFTVIPK